MKRLLATLLTIVVAATPAHATKQIHAEAKVGNVDHEYHLDTSFPNATSAYLNRTKGSSVGEAYAHSTALNVSSGSGISVCSWTFSKGDTKTLKSKAWADWCNSFCGSASVGDVGSHPCTNPHGASGNPADETVVAPPDSANAAGITGTVTSDTNLQVNLDPGSTLRIYTGGISPGTTSSATLDFRVTNANTTATIATGQVVLIASPPNGSLASAPTPTLFKSGVFSTAPLTIQQTGADTYVVDLQTADFTVPGVTPSMVGDFELSVESARPDPDPETAPPTVPATSPWALASLVLLGVLAVPTLLRTKFA